MKWELIPSAKVMQVSKDIWTHAAGIKAEDALFETTKSIMERDLNKLFPTAPKEEGIILKKDPALPKEAYVIDITEDKVILKASSVTGIHHAFSALLQLMSDMEGEICLPNAHIENAPDKDYRALMIDPARAVLPMSYLLQMVDAVRLFGLSVLHIHFSDDQSYSLPSKAFPELPTKGHSYTAEEIGLLVEYADMVGVELMPELETPGHCTKLQEAYPEVFGKCGIVQLSDAAFEGTKKLIDETIELFPNSKRIHIGGDEAKLERWYGDETSVQYMKEHGLSSMHEAYAYFVGQIADYVLSKGKTPVVWEGFPAKFNHLVDTRTEVFAWESYYQLATDLLKSGFKVINASWKPMYIDYPDTYWSPSEINRFWDPYIWLHWMQASPIYHNDLRVCPTEQVIGGELCAWDGRESKYGIEKETELEDKADKVLERLGVLSEKTWNVDHMDEVNEEGETLGKMASFAARYDLIKLWETLSGFGD